MAKSLGYLFPISCRNFRQRPRKSSQGQRARLPRMSRTLPGRSSSSSSTERSSGLGLSGPTAITTSFCRPARSAPTARFSHSSRLRRAVPRPKAMPCASRPRASRKPPSTARQSRLPPRPRLLLGRIRSRSRRTARRARLRARFFRRRQEQSRTPAFSMRQTRARSRSTRASARASPAGAAASPLMMGSRSAAPVRA